MTGKKMHLGTLEKLQQTKIEGTTPTGFQAPSTFGPSWDPKLVPWDVHPLEVGRWGVWVSIIMNQHDFNLH